MIELTPDELKERFSQKIFKQIGQIADELGMEAMLETLRAIDPDSAARLHLADRKRIIRALEVFYETGETITAHNLKTQSLPPRFHPLWLGLDFADRQELYRRIDLRVDIMLKEGLVEEIRNLLAKGISPKATAMQAIGYKEFVEALQGSISIADAAALVQQSSRHYAKRQLTWFRRNGKMHWLIRHGDDSTEKILENARQIIRHFDN